MRRRQGDLTSIPHDSKLRFQQEAAELPPLKLGQLMQLIQEKAPSALREGGNDKTIVVINNIDRPTFDVLNEWGY